MRRYFRSAGIEQLRDGGDGSQDEDGDGEVRIEMREVLDCYEAYPKWVVTCCCCCCCYSLESRRGHYDLLLLSVVRLSVSGEMDWNYRVQRVDSHSKSALIALCLFSEA